MLYHKPTMSEIRLCDWIEANKHLSQQETKAQRLGERRRFGASGRSLP